MPKEAIMNARVKAIAEQAETLTPEEQAELIELLLSRASSDQSDDMDPQLLAEWDEEIAARIAAVESGEVALVSADAVFANYVKSRT
jgi:Putative addiction module component